MKVGDLVETRNGNLVVITERDSCGIYFNVLFCRTGHHRTGFHISKLARVIKK